MKQEVATNNVVISIGEESLPSEPSVHSKIESYFPTIIYGNLGTVCSPELSSDQGVGAFGRGNDGDIRTGINQKFF